MEINKAKEILGEHFAFIADDVAPIIEDLNLPPNARVLDVGTGMGYLATILALKGYQVLTGQPESDDSTYAKSNWLENVRKVGVEHQITFRHFGAEDMPFEDKSFDAVFFLGVLHHVEEDYRLQVLQESYRIAKPNGIVAFFEPNQRGIERVRKHDPTHPEAADPSRYTKGLDWLLKKRSGDSFDAFVFNKQ